MGEEIVLSSCEVCMKWPDDASSRECAALSLQPQRPSLSSRRRPTSIRHAQGSATSSLRMARLPTLFVQTAAITSALLLVLWFHPDLANLFGPTSLVPPVELSTPSHGGHNAPSCASAPPEHSSCDVCPPDDAECHAIGRVRLPDRPRSRQAC